MKVYAIDTSYDYELDESPSQLTNIQFVEIATRQGMVWELKEFEKDFNDEKVFDFWFIRFV